MGVTVTAAVLADAAPPLEITIYDADGAVVVYEVIPAGPSLSEEQYQDVLALIEAGLPAYLAMNLAVANRAGWTLAYAEAKRARQGAG